MKVTLNKLFRVAMFACVTLGTLFTAGCEENFLDRQFDKDEEYMQIYDYIKTRTDLSIYKALCDYSGFSSQVSTAGTYTVFVPHDTAFVNLFKELKI